MKRGGLFITGTDTGVGKTWLTTRLLRHLRERGLDAIGMKPVECGGRDDACALRETSGAEVPLDWINPYPLAEPLAPAAVAACPVIDFAWIRTRYELLAADHDPVLVEGAGGWLVPIDRERTFADLSATLGLPVLLVAANRLGVLNHVLLTQRAIAAVGLECRAVYLNEPGPADPADRSRASNARVLREILPDLAVIEGDVAELAEVLFGD